MAEERKQTTDAQEVQQTAMDAAQVVENPDEGMETFSMEQMEAFYDKSIASFKEGEVVRGRIVETTDDFVLVDIGYKSEGAIPIYEFPDPSSIIIGEEFDVYIEQPEDDDGMPVLSKTKADKIKNWAHIQEVYERDGVIEGRIVRRVKGGLKVDIGVDAFMPASQLTWRPTSDLDRFIGATMEVKIIKLTKRRRNVVVSRRKLLEEQRAGEKARLLSTIEVGQIIPGEVKNITDFGAFVDVGGIDGLLHVTDMSWGRVKHPSQVVSVGDKIQVMVLNFDPDSERISLGLKQKTENPWKTATDRYPIGGVVRGRVVSMTDYGAFVQLEDGIEGMVHVSEMSWTRRVRHPNEVMSLDQQVDVMVLNVDPEAEKIALGLKQTLPNPWREIEERYPVNSTVTGTVRNLTDYGAFVEIEEGIDALLHVSDISWTKKVNHPSEMLERGQQIRVKILSIDPNNEKISVGLKQLESDPWQSVVERTPIGAHVEVEIAKLVSFGAFAKLDNGVEGLIHVSELSDERVQKPEEVLNVGDTVLAKVISIDPVERKIGLSIREYKRDIEQGITSEYAASGTASVSIGEVLGDAVPKSLLRGALDPSEAANELLKEDSAGAPQASQPEPSAEAPAETDSGAEPSAVEEENTKES
ncbi:MAG TPA: 30S ribosomal protein S1 [Candidatus Hydrogenedentes bacterium]|nr:30S ribosomal protein S1 [Candidatus Hydrogenedentota bacterium]HQH51644.1 30S ribosomal protein S1 [Candidatus Hydrogenedentota bacterium]